LNVAADVRPGIPACGGHP